MTSVKGDTKVERFFSSPQLQFLSLALYLSPSPFFSALYVLIRWKNIRLKLGLRSLFTPCREVYLQYYMSPTFSAK